MEELAHTVDTADGKAGDVAIETPHSRCILLAPGDAAPAGTDVTVTLHDGRRLAYAPTLPGPDAGGEVVPDPLLRGNAFVPAHESPRALAALLSIAASRRVETGPESERIFIVFRGQGFVFLENGDTLKVAPGIAAVVPPGVPARLWSQGPEDLLAAALQPRGEPAARRTLASELAKRRAAQGSRE